MEMKSQEESTFVYSKKVTESYITQDKKTRKIDKDKISKVVNSLLTLGKNKSLTDLNLKENCQNWIRNLISSYPNIDDRDAKELLNDFSDEMNTRMRTEEKYAVCIITSEFLILCHSIFGEETITPKLEVIDRMLDKDNVLRFVYFKKEKNELNVVYYEEHPSVFFANWLGISEKEAFEYLGGKNKICGEISGVSFALELSDDDFEKKFIEQKIFKVKDKQIVLPTPIQYIPLSLVKVGRKPYTNFDDFVQDFLAKRYNLNYYNEEYKKLTSSIIPFQEKIFDEKHQVVKQNGTVLVKKTNPNFLILFSNENIEPRASFLAEVKAKLLNDEQFRVYHAGCKISANPIKIKNMEIYNELNCPLSKILLDSLKTMQIKDTFNEIVLGSSLELLYLENRNKPICIFLRDLSKKIFENLDLSNSFANNENDILELKSADTVARENKDIIDYFSDDLSKKIKQLGVKVYIIGADERTKRFEPIPISKFSDDRINTITKSLKEKTKIGLIEIIKIPADNNCLLLMVAKK